MARRRERKPTVKAWRPMIRGRMNPSYMDSVYPDGLPDGWRVEVWANDEYEATVEHSPRGWAYITLKRFDRHAIRDWRHLQSIKNEVVGPEREAFELFPAESRLMDTANQYHLWVLPEGETLSVGQTEREVLRARDVRELNAQTGGRGRQRDWQPGLSTGPTDEERRELAELGPGDLYATRRARREP